MVKKPKFFLIGVIGFLICVISASSFAQEEETLTITTYYPSPYGSYNQLQTNSLGVGDNDGDGVLDSGDVPTNAGEVWIAGRVGIGTTSPHTALEVNGGLRLTPGSLPTGVEGEVRYDSTTKRLVYRSDTQWVGMDPLTSGTQVYSASFGYVGVTVPAGTVWYIFSAYYQDVRDLAIDLGDDGSNDMLIPILHNITFIPLLEIRGPARLRTTSTAGYSIYVWYKTSL